MPGGRASTSSRSTLLLAAKQQLGRNGRLENYSALLGHKGLIFASLSSHFTLLDSRLSLYKHHHRITTTTSSIHNRVRAHCGILEHLLLLLLLAFYDDCFLFAAQRCLSTYDLTTRDGGVCLIVLLLFFFALLVLNRLFWLQRLRSERGGLVSSYVRGLNTAGLYIISMERIYQTRESMS
jgi:hypothetical protein